VPELADTVPGLVAPTNADPETERYLLFEAVAAALTSATADRPAQPSSRQAAAGIQKVARESRKPSVESSMKQ